METIKYDRLVDDAETADAWLVEIGGFRSLSVWNGDVKGEKAPPGLPYPWNRFDYGYVITAHESQGSEFNDVLILNEPVGRGEEAQRWLYTAVTRAAKNCVLVQP